MLSYFFDTRPLLSSGIDIQPLLSCPSPDDRLWIQTAMLLHQSVYDAELNDWRLIVGIQLQPCFVAVALKTISYAL